MANIHPLAYVHPDAKLGEGVIVEPFAVINENVEIGDGTRICSNATIQPYSRIGKNCTIHPNAVIGGMPQDLKFKGEITYAIIGDNNIIRECATVNRGTASKGQTVVGNNNLIMAYCHVAHDCVLHDNIVMSNCVQLAGEVEVEDCAVIGGGSLVHQFTHIGRNVMIQGGSLVNKDIPPFIMAARNPISYVGLNSVGLRRRQFSNESVNEIQSIYRTLYLSGLNIRDAINVVENEFEKTDVREAILNFIKSSTRGILRANI